MMDGERPTAFVFKHDPS